jgi:hypothetical protein
VQFKGDASALQDEARSGHSELANLFAWAAPGVFCTPHVHHAHVNPLF